MKSGNILNHCKNKLRKQNDLNKIQEWSLKWQLFFNGDKCICQHYGYNNPNNDYYFYRLNLLTMSLFN